MKNIFNIFILLTGVNFSVVNEKILEDLYKKVKDIRSHDWDSLDSQNLNDFLKNKSTAKINNQQLNSFKAFKNIEKQWNNRDKKVVIDVKNFNFNYGDLHNICSSDIEEIMISLYILLTNEVISLDNIKKEPLVSHLDLIKKNIKKVYSLYDSNFEKKINHGRINTMKKNKKLTQEKKDQRFIKYNDKFNEKEKDIIKYKNLITNEFDLTSLSNEDFHEFKKLIIELILDYFIKKNPKIQQILLKEAYSNLPKSTETRINNEKIFQDQKSVAPSSELPWGKIVGGIMVFGAITGVGYLIYKKLQSQKKQKIKPKKITKNQT
jgi:hypothetical protein